jgi:hypothetical protein
MKCTLCGRAISENCTVCYTCKLAQHLVTLARIEHYRTLISPAEDAAARCALYEMQVELGFFNPWLKRSPFQSGSRGACSVQTGP